MFDAAASLAQVLDTLDREAREPTLLRAALVPQLRRVIEEGHAEAERRLIADGDGLACAQRISGLTDAVVRAIYDAVCWRLYPNDNPTTGEQLAVVATGGYGRGTMAPGSDIDLLFLLPYKQTAWSESVVEAILYVLWDLKLKVGHATRSVDECLREGRADITIRTALLEARFLFGTRALYEELVTRFDSELVLGTAHEFVDAKLRERDARVAKAGSSRYLVEPNVKDGKGGLRDLNTLFWIAKYTYRVRDQAELVAAGLFTAEEYRLFERCDEFLWRVRCHMHFATGRAEERLSFGLQPKIAERIGVHARGGLSGVERFMKAYFLIAKDVGDLTAIVCAELEARHAKRTPVLDRFIGRFRDRFRATAIEAEDFWIDHGRVNLRAEDAFERDPVNLIRLFWLADRHNLPIHPDAKRLANRSLKLINASLRADAEANRLFLEILASRNSPETILRQMNEAGVLGRFIPDFGRIVAMMQFNMYHHFTVDEHLLRSVGVLADIDAGRVAEEHPLVSRLIGTIQHRRALYVTVLLHDIAKGRPEDHSIAGAAIARKLCPRFGLSQSETDTVAWLVEHHLLMSMTAQSRDLSDPKTIEKFASIVQSLERLKLLTILTVADIKAVGPGVWTAWKGTLLRTLYDETEVVLSGGHSEIARTDRTRLIQMALREQLSDWAAGEFDSYAARHNQAYWLKVDGVRQVKNAGFIRRLTAEGRTVATEVETDPVRGITEITVYSPDHPRLLAIMTGACAASGGNIVDAQIFTTTDGFALDTIFLSRAFDRDEDELRRARRITAAIERALKGEIRIADLVADKHPASARAKTFLVPPDVFIDNALSSRETVVEITGLDRPGLLYELTTALSRLNLNITSAHVATFGERAVDVFYVTDLTGTRVIQPERQRAIRAAVMEVFAGDVAALKAEGLEALIAAPPPREA
ncbi:MULTISPECIES: [protein-PII] uridylyltransferase [Methylobacterium]|uniref:Bifunctional uridylyltransferase/uridylyl-removing enzyme n=4 Tax=Pseudomonadota TaxID=1224 RepID=A0ABQ4SYH9_9HYPH|nr:MULTISPECIES: [protein-PII] uridylyltransferase [Methylobacterium]PIU06340.1 MAG: [protein-PII] uridylyltransferase [Methylobacterium sp. CG09_land_8_20_14_0_10_71_15]PIU13663.1 MAG: [protein-PII] uridylyltransferase [Methylobacterium sp. CG08_land_8_20_14_0_20_71_15]GBU17435.1 uridylyltransferase [Methylobacterium sp.]GJE08261.1 Bifunctional uridylyltransferase/uridylyl-removing enzyme [Methylobacterium jeotgali]